MSQPQQQALMAVWNATQSGNPDDLGIAPATLDALVAARFLATWSTERGVFYMLTEVGKKQAGLRSRE